MGRLRTLVYSLVITATGYASQRGLEVRFLPAGERKRDGFCPKQGKARPAQKVDLVVPGDLPHLVIPLYKLVAEF